MKKMKCTSCGGNLTIDENNKFAVCDYCKTKYKLDEDNSAFTNEVQKVALNTFKGAAISSIVMSVVIGLIALAIFGMAFFIIISQF